MYNIFAALHAHAPLRTAVFTARGNAPKENLTSLPSAAAKTHPWGKRRQRTKRAMAGRMHRNWDPCAKKGRRKTGGRQVWSERILHSDICWRVDVFYPDVDFKVAVIAGCPPGTPDCGNQWPCSTQSRV
jgi:hypothetical protein